MPCLRQLLTPLVLLAASALIAQSCPPRLVNVEVLDDHNLPVAGLTPANFKASHDRQPLNVLSATFRAEPAVRTVVLLSEMAPPQIARPAVLEFISTAPPQAPISMFTFSTGIERRFNSSEGRQPMKDWLVQGEGQSSRKGFSGLAQVLLTIIKAMEPAHTGDAIYVVTGNADPSFFELGNKLSPPMMTDLANELRSSGIRLFVLVLEVIPHRAWDVIQPDNNLITAPYVPKGPPALADLVRVSGGLSLNWYPGTKSVSFGPSFEYNDRMRAAIHESSRAFQSAISNFYQLTVDSVGLSPAPEDWNLEVVDSQGKKLKKVTLAYPSKIGGCSAAAR